MSISFFKSFCFLSIYSAKKKKISEALCNIEDWFNGCWKFSFALPGINYILKYIKKTFFFKYNISQYYYFSVMTTLWESSMVMY